MGTKQSELNISFPLVSELNTVNDWQFTDNIRTWVTYTLIQYVTSPQWHCTCYWPQHIL